MNFTPKHLEPQHQLEWLESSVDPHIIELNVKSLAGHDPLEYLLYNLPQTGRRNDGRLRDRYLKQYAHTSKGGWWVSGRDPLNDWEPMEWGRFKPDAPRQGWDKETQQLTEKPVKYESPLKTSNRITYLRVPLHTWQAVAKTYGLPMPEDVMVSSEGEAVGFWAWVKAHPQIPIVLVEGEKKAGSLLSLGFVAVALPGIWGGRVDKAELERMHPDLVPMGQLGRKFTILFDYETKPKIKLDVYRATYRTGWVINRQGCRCSVALLPGPQKGVDDWIAVLKEKAHKSVIALLGDARSLGDYQQWFRLNGGRGIKKYKPNIHVNTRYLSQAVPKLPTSGLVCLESGMGTGKTELGRMLREERPDATFLNTGHRVALLRNLAERLKTVMYSAVNALNLAEAKHLSITADSLYKLANNIQAYGCVFIDEACQFLAHLLKSKTCRSYRASILEVLEAVVYRAKLVILADAHLDDLTIDFFRAMRPPGEEPFIIKNDWKTGGREVFWYEGSNSSELVDQIHTQVLLGKKAIVVSDSKRFIKKVERSLFILDDARTEDKEDTTIESEEDQRLRIWAIHSENSGSEENSIFISEINDAVTTIDVLLASPSLGTGVDISVPHFDVIFGAFHAISQSSTECAQQLWRNRKDVPMHVWTAERPPFGYAETNPRRIKERYLQKNVMTAFLLRIDRETGKRGAEKDWALETSCLIEAQRNWSVNNLRQDLRSLLEEMGNTITSIGDRVNESALKRMKAAGKQLDHEHCEAVAGANDIDQDTYKARQNQDYLKPQEALECEKFRIRDTYGLEVTPELVEKDDSGRLISKLASLEAILAEPGEVTLDDLGKEIIFPPEIVASRDRFERDTLPICTDWGNHSAVWITRHTLGLKNTLLAMMSGQAVNNSSEILQSLTERAQKYRQHIKQLLGLTIPTDASPMWILGSLLEQLGLATSSRRVGEKGKRVRNYTLSTAELEFAQQVLSYRQQRRDEKERKRKLDQEITAKRAAGITAQYGLHSPPSPVSTPPPYIGGEYFQGGSGHEPEEEQVLGESEQQQEEMPSGKLSNWVTEYTCRVRTAFKRGVDAAKSLFDSLVPEDAWAVILFWESEDLQSFNQFVELVPDWVSWCN